MINWTKDERITALLPQVIAHMNEHDEFSLAHEKQMQDIRNEYITDLFNEYRSEDYDAFEEWHSQPTVEEFFAEIVA